MRKASFTLVLITMIGSACEKGQSGQSTPETSLPVVEGIIEENGYPMVMLSGNQAYFAGDLPSGASGAWVHGAAVTVSNGPQSQRLREYRLSGKGGRDFWVYTVDTAQLPYAFRGETGKSYTLTIESGRKTMSAITTIPAHSLRLDSAWSASGGLMVRLTGSPGAYARYFTARNGGDYLPGMHPLSAGSLGQGTVEVALREGVDRSGSLPLGEWRKGDTVWLKFCNVDHRTYDFWRSTGYAWAEGEDPLGPEVRAQGNVSGARGYWGGHSVTFERIIIPK